MLVSEISIQGRSNTSTKYSTHLGEKLESTSFVSWRSSKIPKARHCLLECAKAIGMTARTLLELRKEQKKDAIENIDSEAR